MKIGNFELPRVGQRIVRSVIAVLLCFCVYYIRGCKGIPFYSALAVLQCMQPYHNSSIKMAKKRTLGTLIGAFWGLIVILLRLHALSKISMLLGIRGANSVGGNIDESFLGYVLVSIFTGVVIYSTVVLNCKNTAYFSCVVFLSVTVMHITDENPFLFVLNRVVDTLIGVFLAIGVNDAHLPRAKNTDILFVAGMDETLLTSKEKLTDYSKIELNRIIDLGANITISTLRTPATVRETLTEVHLKLPIIAMNGAVLYDMNENKFLMSYRMSYRKARRILNFFEEEQENVFTNVIVDDVLVIYYEQLQNDAERAIYEEMRKSPYRNYIKRGLPEREEVVYFMFIDKKERTKKLFDALMNRAWASEYHMITYDSHDYPGYAYIKIYDKEATREHMLQNLSAMLDIDKTVVFGSVEGKCDVLIKDSDHNIMVKKLKRMFEPVSFGKKKSYREKKRPSSIS